MKCLIPIVCILIFLVNCACETSSEERPQTDVVKSEYQDSHCDNNEYLHLDSLLIDGVLPFVAPVSQFQNLFGLPLLAYDVSKEDTYFRQNEAEKVMREVYDGLILDVRDESGIVNTIDLKQKNVSIKYKDLVLSENTSIAEMCDIFPVTCAQAEPWGGYLWTGHMSLKAYPQASHDRVYLIFGNNKLLKVRYVSLFPL